MTSPITDAFGEHYSSVAGSLPGRDLPWLRYSIGPQMPAITAPAWRRLTVRYSLFFLATAVLNEAIWRSQPTDLWVLFKSYGAPLLLLLFIASQVPFVRRHRVAA